MCRPALMTATVMLAVVCACTKAPDAAAAIEAAPSGASNACATDLGPRELRPILGASGVVATPVAGDAEACRFEGREGTAVVIGLRHGDEVPPFWKLALDAKRQAMIPLAGVGHAALRTLDGSEIIARQGDLSCQADFLGGPVARLRIPPGSLATDLAALCRRVFAGRRA